MNPSETGPQGLSLRRTAGPHAERQTAMKQRAKRNRYEPRVKALVRGVLSTILKKAQMLFSGEHQEGRDGWSWSCSALMLAGRKFECTPSERSLCPYCDMEFSYDFGKLLIAINCW